MLYAPFITRFPLQVSAALTMPDPPYHAQALMVHNLLRGHQGIPRNIPRYQHGAPLSTIYEDDEQEVLIPRGSPPLSDHPTHATATVEENIAGLIATVESPGTPSQGIQFLISAPVFGEGDKTESTDLESGRRIGWGKH